MIDSEWISGSRPRRMRSSPRRRRGRGSTQPPLDFLTMWSVPTSTSRGPRQEEAAQSTPAQPWSRSIRRRHIFSYHLTDDVRQTINTNRLRVFSVRVHNTKDGGGFFFFEVNCPWFDFPLRATRWSGGVGCNRSRSSWLQSRRVE